MKYFNEAKENMLCPCGCGAKLSDDIKSKLDKLRGLYGKPIYIVQGATCEDYSVNHVHRKSTSTHIDKGNGAYAVDISSKTFKNKKDYFDFIAIAIQVGFYGFGQGSYWLGCGTDKRLHIDTKKSASGDVRSWTY